MQKLIFSIALFCALNSTCKAQTKVFLDESGNYVSVPRLKNDEKFKETGKYFINKTGAKLPVCVSTKGKEFVFVVSKTGNRYRKYLTIEN